MVKRVVPVAAFIHRIDNYIYLVPLPYSTSVKIPVAHYSFYTPLFAGDKYFRKGSSR